VNARDVQEVAYHQLLLQLPDGYGLTDAQYTIGEAAEEDVGLGEFTFYVSAQGFAMAKVDAEAAKELCLGLRVEDAASALQETLPLAAAPEITVSPAWFPYVPRLPIRTEIEVRTSGFAP
jgi:hypothetical protein